MKEWEQQSCEERGTNANAGLMIYQGLQYTNISVLPVYEDLHANIARATGNPYTAKGATLSESL